MLALSSEPVKDHVDGVRALDCDAWDRSGEIELTPGMNGIHLVLRVPIPADFRITLTGIRFMVREDALCRDIVEMLGKSSEVPEERRGWFGEVRHGDSVLLRQPIRYMMQGLGIGSRQSSVNRESSKLHYVPTDEISVWVGGPALNISRPIVLWAETSGVLLQSANAVNSQAIEIHEKSANT